MIRNALPTDYPAIRTIIRNAFHNDDEANLVEHLREDGDALFELVYGFDASLAGHILYSRLRIERQDSALEAAALAPLAVLPAFQRKGLGAALICAGNAHCAALGLDAVIVLGHADYYPRFGFSPELARALDAPFAGESFMALELRPGALSGGGKVRYSRAFGV